MIWLRIWSFFIGPGFGKWRWAAADWPACPTTICPTVERALFPSLLARATARMSPPKLPRHYAWGIFMRRSTPDARPWLAAALWSAPGLAQPRTQLGPLCTTDTTPADQQIDACNKIIALKVFSGEQLATIYFWRAVGWNKKGNYTQVIADATEALRLQPNVAALQSARLGLLRQGRVRHRDRRLQRRAADRASPAASSFTTAATPGAPRANTPRRSPTTISRSSWSEVRLLLSEPRRLEAGARRSRWRARRHQRSDPARPDTAAAVDQPRRDLARQGRFRPRHRRHHRGDPAGEGEVPVPTHDVARQRADPPMSARASPMKRRVTSNAPRPTTPQRWASTDRRQQGQSATAKVRLSLLSKLAPSRDKPADATRTMQPPPACAPRHRGERRIALVIGNGAYAHVTALPNPPNDARAIAKSLRDIGFEVTEGIDLDRAAMQKTTRDFLRDAAGAKIAVVYYAGHGVQIDGRNYLVPVDVELKRRHLHDRCDDRHGHDPGRPRRPGPHQHPDPRCLPQQSDGAAGRIRRRQSRHRSRIGPCCAGRARCRRDARRRHADCVRDRARHRSRSTARAPTARSRRRCRATSARPASRCSRC